MGSYFQHEMSLKRRKWVDHLSHGDRNERLANTHHRPTEVLSSGHVGGGSAEDRYGFIQRTFQRFHYSGLRRADKGIVLRYLGRMAGIPVSS